MKKRVLVVDDEPDFVELITMRLRASGYEVLTASGGLEALEKIKRDRPDAVLLDILMPDLDGLNVLKKIRSLDKKLPVYMLTAFSNEERFELARKFKASGFIVKTKDLAKEIRNITNSLRMADRYKGDG